MDIIKNNERLVHCSMCGGYEKNILISFVTYEELVYLCEQCLKKALTLIVGKKRCASCHKKESCDILYALKYASQEVNENEFYCSEYERKED